mmetsp:Transcript_38758/g.86200  ORF Transcript_38758/g.86200 Transcript_38758/m.86200 type:complete len:80 (-) Transcript_38758:1417-1656(-)
MAQNSGSISPSFPLLNGPLLPTHQLAAHMEVMSRCWQCSPQHLASNHMLAAPAQALCAPTTHLLTSPGAKPYKQQLCMP